MRQIFLITVLLFAILSLKPAWAQADDPLSGGTHTFEFAPISLNTVKYDYDGVTCHVNPISNSDRKLGTEKYEKGGYSITEKYRTRYVFNISIPSVAESISDVQIVYSTSSVGNYKLKFGKLNISAGYVYCYTIYDNIAGMQPFLSNAPYGDHSINSIQLGEILFQNKGASIVIGVMSEDEEAADSYSDLTFSIKGKYTIPLSTAKLTVKNNDPNGGIIKVGVDEAAQNVSSPYVNENFIEHSVANMEAVDQQINGEYKGWDANCRWGKFANGVLTNNFAPRQIEYTSKWSEKDVTFTANLTAGNCVSGQYNNPGKGLVTVTKEGVAKTVAAGGESFIVAGQNTLTLTAIYNTVDNINYSFQGWKNDATDSIESTNPIYTIDPEENRSYTAIFQGTANTSMMNVQSNCSQAGQRPVLTWTDNPNDAVSYKIYMMMVPNGNTVGNYSPTHIANVAKGVQYYQHPTFEINNNPGMDDLFLEVKAYYSTENTLVSAGWA